VAKLFVTTSLLRKKNHSVISTNFIIHPSLSSKVDQICMSKQRAVIFKALNTFKTASILYNQLGYIRLTWLNPQSKLHIKQQGWIHRLHIAIFITSELCTYLCRILQVTFASKPNLGLWFIEDTKLGRNLLIKAKDFWWPLQRSFTVNPYNSNKNVVCTLLVPSRAKFARYKWLGIV